MRSGLPPGTSSSGSNGWPQGLVTEARLVGDRGAPSSCRIPLGGGGPTPPAAPTPGGVGGRGSGNGGVSLSEAEASSDVVSYSPSLGP